MSDDMSRIMNYLLTEHRTVGMVTLIYFLLRNQNFVFISKRLQFRIKLQYLTVRKISNAKSQLFVIGELKDLEILKRISII